MSEQLMHTRDHHHHWGFVGGEQALAKGFEHRIVLNGADTGHEEGGAHRAAPAPGAAFAPALPGFAKPRAFVF